MTGFRRVVAGLDGSPHSRRAGAFAARLTPPRGRRVVCMHVIEPVGVSSMPFVPRAMRSQIAGQADAVNRSRVAAARGRPGEAPDRILDRELPCAQLS